MSKYTTEVRFICESKSGLSEETLNNSDPYDVAELAVPRIFKSTYVIGDAEYDLHIKRQILLHYYTREISEETFGLWKLRLNARLAEKLTWYNTLYAALAKQAEIAQDPFLDTDYKRNVSEDTTEKTDGTDIFDRTGSGTAYNYRTDNLNTARTGTDRTENDKSDTQYRLHSDTPEGSVAGINAEIEGMEGSGFLSDAQKITDSAEDNTTTTYGSNVANTGTSKIDSGETRNFEDVRDYTDNREGEKEVVETFKGKKGSKTLMNVLSEFREELMNLDEIIINDFKDLFIMLW